MSSILDALKKLEEEKAVRTAEPESVPFEPAQAGRALFGKPEVLTSGISPLAFFAGGGLFAIVVACVSVAAALWYTRLPEPTQVSAVDPTSQEVPVQPTISDTPGVEEDTPNGQEPIHQPAATTPNEVNEDSETPVTETSDVEPVAVTVEQPEPNPEIIPPISVEPIESAPKSTDPVEQPTPQPKPVSPVNPPVESISEPLPADLSTLPPLRVSDEIRYGLEGLQINALFEPSRNRPLGNAVINMERIYIGESIPGRSAKLVGISRGGIAIEIEGSGERFFVRFGSMR